MANENLHKAKEAKNDEFYTQLNDVSEELRHYKEHFKDKIIFCNCDDPTWSAFWRYFHLNFEHLGLKKLISTHYDRHDFSICNLFYNHTVTMAALFSFHILFCCFFCLNFGFISFFCVRIDKTKCHITKDSSMWLNVSILVMSSLNCFSVISGGISGPHVSPSFLLTVLIC